MQFPNVRLIVILAEVVLSRKEGENRPQSTSGRGLVLGTSNMLSCDAQMHTVKCVWVSLVRAWFYRKVFCELALKNLWSCGGKWETAQWASPSGVGHCPDASEQGVPQLCGAEAVRSEALRPVTLVISQLYSIMFQNKEEKETTAASSPMMPRSLEVAYN